MTALLVMATLAPAFGCAATATADEKKDIVATAIEAGSFKTLAAALEAADLATTLRSPGPFTVFAPTDEAFAKLPTGTVDALLKDVPRLKGILTHHVIAGDVRAEPLAKRSGATSLHGRELRIGAADGKVKVGEALVVKTDLVCSNGVIHGIDRVLLPPPAEAEAPKATLVVRVSSITESKGTLRYLLFKSDSGFPRDSRQAATGGTEKVASTNDLTVRIPDLPYGEYAVSVFQDLDDNGTLKTSFFGIPREPVGASNDPKSRTGPPRYEDAKFTVSAPETRILIHLVHP